MLKNWYINLNKLLITISLLVLVQPELLTTGTINAFYKYGGILTSAVLLFLILVKKVFDKSLLWIFTFFGAGLFITIINSAYTSEYIREHIGSFGLCCLFFLCMKKKVEWLVDAFAVLDIYVIINLITVIKYRYSLLGTRASQYWLFGNGNYHIRMLLPILAISLLRDYLKKGKPGLHFIIMLVVSFITCILNDSATGKLTIVVFVTLVLVFRPEKKELPQWFTLNRFLFITILADLAIVVFRLQNIFSFIIEGVLKKSITLTGRTDVWDRTFPYILNKPWIGYGFLIGDAYQILLWENHPHNYFMYILMTGGLVFLSILIIGIYLANQSLKNTIQFMVSKIVLFALICFMFMGIDESLTKAPLLYPFLILGMESSNLRYRETIDTKR